MDGGNAAIAPLFEKLRDDCPERLFEKDPKRFLTFQELQESIARDLSDLLCTRVAPEWERTPTPLSYGANIIAPASVENVSEVHELESRIDNAIARFESRLINAKSRVIDVGSDPSKVFIIIEARVNVWRHRTPISFPLVIDA
ncbi:MAG: type VI secretion system baseplate subunit TssE [Holosporaceae bacterium]|jgi:type VI secretion system lysozyme-like protein|nr:type VI secretion system baseplate subunit TssE [Holosporaceae bacterium]